MTYSVKDLYNTTLLTQDKGESYFIEDIRDDEKVCTLRRVEPNQSRCISYEIRLILQEINRKWWKLKQITEIYEIYEIF